MTQAPNIFLSARTQLNRLALGQVSAADEVRIKTGASLLGSAVVWSLEGVLSYRVLPFPGGRGDGEHDRDHDADYGDGWLTYESIAEFR